MLGAVVLGLLGLGAMAPGAAAQDMQAQLTSPGFGETPARLPATYETTVTLEIFSPGGLPCLCEETHVAFLVSDGPDVDTSFEPATFTIDWPSYYLAHRTPSAQATLTTNLTVHVPASMAGQPDQRLTLDADAENRGGLAQAQQIHVAATQVLLTFPPAEDAEAETASAEQTPSQSSVPGPGAALVLAISCMMAVAVPVVRCRS